RRSSRRLGADLRSDLSRSSPRARCAGPSSHGRLKQERTKPMNASLHARYPRWQKVLGALLWELVWKNQIFMSVLLVFDALCGGFVLAVDNAPPYFWLSSYARGSGCILFLSSILLAFAPFTLMDNHGSWRMNSITSRWSVLPARTSFLV